LTRSAVHIGTIPVALRFPSRPNPVGTLFTHYAWDELLPLGPY
jgi:hypothetical protein